MAKEKQLTELNIRNIDKIKKRKAICYCKCKGSDLSKVIRKKIDELADQFDKMKK